MIAQGGPGFELLAELSTLEQQTPRETLLWPRTAVVCRDVHEPPVGGPSLHARCVSCGAATSDWRHLLGVGARVVASAAGAQSALLTYPGACSRCGGSKLLVDA